MERAPEAAPAATTPPPPRPNPPIPGESRDQRALRILDTDRTTFSFEKIHLGFLLQYLSVRHGLNLVLEGDLEQEVSGLEITVKVEDFTVRDAIREVLKAREDLTVVVRDGCVVVVRK